MSKEKIDYIGDRLKELRLKNEKRIKDVADELGCTQQYISQIEKNVQDVNRTMLMKLSRFYNVSVDYLIFGDIEEEKQIKNEDFKEDLGSTIENKQINEIIESHRNLSEAHVTISKTNNDLSSQIIKINDFMIEIFKQKF